MRAGVDKHLGRERVAFGRAGTPGAAVNENEDRCIRFFGHEDIERLNRRGAIVHALWIAEPSAGLLAARGVTLEYLAEQGGVERLIVGRVELGLIHVHPDVRPLRVWQRPEWAVFCTRSSRAKRGRRA